MKTILFILSLGISSLLQAQGTADDRLFWSAGRRLTFADFGGQPELSDTTRSATAEGRLTHRLGAINKSIDITFATAAGSTKFGIRAGMKRRSSWIRSRTDSVTLAHEQGHFDLCELYARMLRRDIRKARSLAEAKALFDEAVQAEEAEQDRYDKENTYEGGGITKAWAADIRARIEALGAFASPVVILKFDK